VANALRTARKRLGLRQPSGALAGDGIQRNDAGITKKPEMAVKLNEPNMKEESFEDVVKSAQAAAVLGHYE
jgi:hypothetical protein